MTFVLGEFQRLSAGLIILIAGGLLGAGTLHAEWRLVSSEKLTEGAVQQVRKKIAEDGNTATLHLLLLDQTRCALRVIDNPGARMTLAESMEKIGALAGVNGGYFHPDYTPLGLRTANGRILHPLEKAKLLSGVFAVAGTRGALLRTGEIASVAKFTEAVQAGPFLVDRGKAVAGLNATRIAARTMILSDGAGRVALAVCQSATLAETARILVTPGVVTEMKIARALNLDGGSSTALWVRGDGGAPFSIREYKGVRDFIAITPLAK